MGPNETQLRKIIDGARRCGVWVPAVAAQMLRDARMDDLEARVFKLEKQTDAGAKHG